MLTLIAWLRCCQPSFSTIIVLFFFSVSYCQKGVTKFTPHSRGRELSLTSSGEGGAAKNLWSHVQTTTINKYFGGENLRLWAFTFDILILWNIIYIKITVLKVLNNNCNYKMFYRLIIICNTEYLLCARHCSKYSAFIVTLWGGKYCYCLYLIDANTEAQRRYIMYPLLYA